MRKFIKILLLVILTLAIILSISWLISRKKAQNAGLQPKTFKEFLNWGTKTPPGTTGGNGDLGSVFVDDNINTQTPGQEVTNTPGTLVSQFTNSSTAPTNPGSGGGNNGTVVPTDNNGSPAQSPGPDPTLVVNPVTVSPIIPGPECSDADLNIRFTAQELAQLQVLQNRFYAVAQSVHSDGDAATETGNWSNFKAKSDKFAELYNFCKSRTYDPTTTAYKVIEDARYKIRIPTPFWNEKDTLFRGIKIESDVFLAGNGPADGVLYPPSKAQITAFGDYTKPLTPQPISMVTISDYNVTTGVINPGDVRIQTDGNVNNRILFALRSLERSLRINLW